MQQTLDKKFHSSRDLHIALFEAMVVPPREADPTGHFSLGQPESVASVL
ncbi:MAG TPA: hypothetical protein VKA19_14090 [Alphaproteobacteria bacterium]|nr:hypothetical protein [Alphaproteobacteria bacterium]